MYQTWLGLPPAAWLGYVDTAIMADNQIVGTNPLGDHCGLGFGIVRQDLARTGCGRVQPAVRPKRLAIGVFGTGNEKAHISIQADLVGFTVRNVVEKDLASRVGGGALGEAVSSGRPVANSSGIKISRSCWEAKPCLYGQVGQSFHSQRIASAKILVACSPLWPPVPQEWFTSQPAKVRARSISWLAIHQSPSLAILAALPSWRKTRIGLGSNLRINVGYSLPPRRPDVAVPIAAEDATERIRAFPGGREGAYRAAAGPRDGAVVASRRQTDRPSVRCGFLLDFGKELFLQKSNVVGAQGCRTRTAIDVISRSRQRALHPSGRDEHPDHDGHFFLMNQLVEDFRSPILDAVLIHI